MHFKKILFYITLSYILIGNIQAQSNTIERLDEAVTKQNDAQEYEKSITAIVNYISDENRTNYEKYRAYLLKAYTYKRVFNYLETLQNLDLALNEGLKSDKPEEAINTIKSQKAFVFFDTLEYQKAAQLMTELAQSNYAYLSPEDRCFLIMQEGYLLMMGGKNVDAEKKLNQALLIAQEYCPRNLPNIYGKKIELYNNMKQFDKRDQCFREGLKIAKKYKIIKYKMYLYEIMRNQYQNNEDYKNAFETQLKVDSLTYIYDTNLNNGKIQILETEMSNKRIIQEQKSERNIKYLLIGFISILLLLLFISNRLYISNKQKNVLVENENIRIHKEIEDLTNAIDKMGNKRLDVSSYNFTERQKEIISLIQESKTNKEIATTLFISENTVKYHLKIIYEILKVENRSQIY